MVRQVNKHAVSKYKFVIAPDQRGHAALHNTGTLDNKSNGQVTYLFGAKRARPQQSWMERKLCCVAFKSVALAAVVGLAPVGQEGILLQADKG